MGCGLYERKKNERNKKKRSMKRLPCRNRSDTSNLKIYFEFAFVLNSLFIRRHQFHQTTSSALIAEYLLKPARNSKNDIYIYIYT